MITFIILLIVGVVLFFVFEIFGCILGLVTFGYAPKPLIITYWLLYLIPISAILYGAYGIIRHLFF